MLSCPFIWASNKLQPKYILGRGSQGIVTCVKNEKSSQALKYFFEQDSLALDLETLTREIFGSTTSRERLALWYSDTDFAIVSQLWDLCLVDVLDIVLQFQGAVKAQILRDVQAPIVNQLIEMKRFDLVHRDIKPGNILLKVKDRTTCLTDFGLVGGSGSADSIIQSLPFRPPEIFQKQLATFDSDVFCLGMNLLLAYHGNLLTNDCTEGQLLDLLQEMPTLCLEMGFVVADDQLLRTDADAFLGRLLWKMCQKNPEERITMQQVYDDPFWTFRESHDSFWALVESRQANLKLERLTQGLQNIEACEAKDLLTLCECHETIGLKCISYFDSITSCAKHSVLSNIADEFHFTNSSIKLAESLQTLALEKEIIVSNALLFVIAQVSMVLYTGYRGRMQTKFQKLHSFIDDSLVYSEIKEAFQLLVDITGGLLPV